MKRIFLGAVIAALLAQGALIANAGEGGPGGPNPGATPSGPEGRGPGDIPQPPGEETAEAHAPDHVDHGPASGHGETEGSTRGNGHFGSLPTQPSAIPADTATPPCATINGQTSGNLNSVKFFYARYSDESSLYSTVVGANNASGLAETIDKLNWTLKNSEPLGYQQRIRMHCARSTQPTGAPPPTDKITELVLSTKDYSTPGTQDCPAFSFCAMKRSMAEQFHLKANKAYMIFLDTARNNGNGMGSQAEVCQMHTTCVGVATEAWNAVANHEFTHMMGAPHTTGGCWTGSGYNSAEPADVMNNWWSWWRRDGGGDDYYNTYNGYDPSFYCGAHNDVSIGGWNAVRSPWVEKAP
jgi:hypothetical protein